MSEFKLSAEQLDQFKKRIDDLTLLLHSHSEKPQKGFKELLEQIKMLTNEINDLPSPYREELTLQLLQPFFMEIRVLKDKNAREQFFNVIMGALDVPLIKKILFERSPAWDGELPFAYFFEDGSNYEILRFLHDKYPEWVDIRTKFDEKSGGQDYFYDKDISDPFEYGEYSLIGQLIGNNNLSRAEFLLEQGADVYARVVHDGEENALQYFDVIKSVLFKNTMDPREVRAHELAQFRTKIEDAMVAQIEKGKKRIAIEEALSKLPAGIHGHITGSAGLKPKVPKAQRSYEERYTSEIGQKYRVAKAALAGKDKEQVKKEPPGTSEIEPDENKPKPKGT